MTVSATLAAEAQPPAGLLSPVRRSLRAAGAASDSRMAGFAALAQVSGPGGNGVPKRRRLVAGGRPAAKDDASASLPLRQGGVARLSSFVPGIAVLQRITALSGPAGDARAAWPLRTGLPWAGLPRKDLGMPEPAIPPEPATLRAAQVGLRMRGMPSGLALRLPAQDRPLPAVLADDRLRAADVSGSSGAIAGKRLPPCGGAFAERLPTRAVIVRGDVPQVNGIMPSGPWTARGLDRAYAAPTGAARSDMLLSGAASRMQRSRRQAIAATVRQGAALTTAKGVPRRLVPGADGWTPPLRHAVGADTSSGRREAASLRHPGTQAAQSAERLAASFQGNSQGETTIALTGDIVIDGRKLGRIAAATQVSSASLPPRSASSVNLRAMPVFTGSSVPL